MVDILTAPEGSQFIQMVEFNGVKYTNRIIKICGDQTSLDRKIAYFAFADRPHANKEQYIKYLKQQPGGSGNNVFALWEHDVTENNLIPLHDHDHDHDEDLTIKFASSRSSKSILKDLKKAQELLANLKREMNPCHARTLIDKADNNLFSILRDNS